MPTIIDPDQTSVQKFQLPRWMFRAPGFCADGVVRLSAQRILMAPLRSAWSLGSSLSEIFQHHWWWHQCRHLHGHGTYHRCKLSFPKLHWLMQSKQPVSALWSACISAGVVKSKVLELCLGCGWWLNTRNNFLVWGNLNIWILWFVTVGRCFDLRLTDIVILGSVLSCESWHPQLHFPRKSCKRRCIERRCSPWADAEDLQNILAQKSQQLRS